MAAHQLAVDAGQHVGELKVSGLPGDVGVEGHLHQQVAKFVGQQLGVSLVDGLQHLVGLFHQVAFQRLMGLLPVPGTPARGTQARHDVDQGLELANFFAGVFTEVFAGVFVRRLFFNHGRIIEGVLVAEQPARVLT